MNLKARSVYFIARTMGVFPFWIVRKLGLISASHYALMCDCVLVAHSSLFDSKWYYSRYPGVARSGMPAAWHYCRYGWREGRCASATFSGEKYLEANPDVRKANVNPLAHYIRVCRREGRRLFIRHENKNLRSAVVAQPERFCPARYCALYRDVAEIAQKDKSYPEKHYFARGRTTGRSNGYDAPQARGGGPLFSFEPGDVLYDPVKPNCVIVAHESSRTGCPINTWSMLRELRARYNVLAVSLKRGVLDDLFRREATWYGSFHEMVRGNEAYLELALADALDARVYDFAIVNSVVCHAVLAAFAWHRIPTVVCIHEFAQYCTPAHILDCFLYGTQVVYSSKACLDATRARIGAVAADVPIIPQGKSTLPVDSKARPSGRELYHITRLTGLRRDKGELIVLGCGTVEYRKGFDLFHYHPIAA